jgi:hypothetical protein
VTAGLAAAAYFTARIFSLARGEASNSLKSRERSGDTMALDPCSQSGSIPPGSYNRDTLPPLSEDAKAILARVRKTSERFANEGVGLSPRDIELGMKRVIPDDVGVPSIDTP